MTEPKSLQEAIVYFSNPDNCIDYLAVRRWPNGSHLSRLRFREGKFNANRRTWKCGSHHAKREFSIKVGTIMEDSPIALDKWLTATWLVTNCKNGISSYEIARDVKVTQKSAWFMLHRIRLAMQDDFFGPSSAAKSKWTKPSSAAKRATCTSASASAASLELASKDKTAVMGILERGGKVRATVVPNRARAVLQDKSASMSPLALPSTPMRCSS